MRCKFKIDKLGYKCPLDALPGEKFCYWHKKEDGKIPDLSQLEELKRKVIKGAYLKEARLSLSNLQKACLERANLQGAILYGAELQKANLRGANLQGANLIDANLEDANLSGAYLQRAKLCANFQKAKLKSAHLQYAEFRGAKLQEAELKEAKLYGADLSYTNLEGANLWMAELEGTNLESANLQGTNLEGANLRGANLTNAKFDSKTDLDGADLTFANLFRSYVDETLTLRNARLFKKFNGYEKEINEIVADRLGTRIWSMWGKNLMILDVQKIRLKSPKIASSLFEKGLVRYIENKEIVFYNEKSKRIVRGEGEEEKIEGLTELVEEECIEIETENEDKLKKKLYEASYEVYNNLYYFYVSNGKIDEAFKVHYRRNEVYRKLLKERGIHNWLISWIFDFLILRLLTGY